MQRRLAKTNQAKWDKKRRMEFPFLVMERAVMELIGILDPHGRERNRLVRFFQSFFRMLLPSLPLCVE
jgi:hypothetical protein